MPVTKVPSTPFLPQFLRISFIGGPRGGGGRKFCYRCAGGPVQWRKLNCLPYLMPKGKVSFNDLGASMVRERPEAPESIKCSPGGHFSPRFWIFYSLPPLDFLITETPKGESFQGIAQGIRKNSPRGSQ